MLCERIHMDTAETSHLYTVTNPLDAELNPICRALLGAHHIVHVSRLRVNAKEVYQPNAEYL